MLSTERAETGSGGAEGATRRAGSPRVRFVHQELGASTRYRVHHQIEQARLAGMDASAQAIGPRSYVRDLDGCDLLYLHRLALWPSTLRLIALARRRRIPIVFDSDDLVWDPRDRYYSFMDAHLSRVRVARTVLWIYRVRALMRWSDAFVFSTPYLAALAERTFRQPAYVNPNVLSEAMLADAQAARASRAERDVTLPVVLGYFCGTPHVHDEDLAGIAPALAAVLDRLPQARLRIYGRLDLTGALAEERRAGQIERRPVVHWRELPRHVAAVDVNVAPLVDNPQRRAKSAVKYLEAAAVGVPTVAARMEPFEHAIVDRSTGLLASGGAEWQACVLGLACSPELRAQLGAAALTHVQERYTTRARAPHFAAILDRVAGGAAPAGGFDPARVV